MEKKRDNFRVKKQFESALLPWEHICYLPIQLLAFAKPGPVAQRYREIRAPTREV